MLRRFRQETNEAKIRSNRDVGLEKVVTCILDSQKERNAEVLRAVERKDAVVLKLNDTGVSEP